MARKRDNPPSPTRGDGREIDRTQAVAPARPRPGPSIRRRRAPPAQDHGPESPSPPQPRRRPPCGAAIYHGLQTVYRRQVIRQGPATANAVVGFYCRHRQVAGGTIEFDGRDIPTLLSTNRWVELLDTSGTPCQSNLNPVLRGLPGQEALLANNVVRPKSGSANASPARKPACRRASDAAPSVPTNSPAACASTPSSPSAWPHPKLRSPTGPALDVIVQRRILDHLGKLTAESKTTVAVHCARHSTRRPNAPAARRHAPRRIVGHLESPGASGASRLSRPSLASARIESAHKQISGHERERELTGAGKDFLRHLPEKYLSASRGLTKIRAFVSCQEGQRHLLTVDNVSSSCVAARPSRGRRRIGSGRVDRREHDPLQLHEPTPTVFPGRRTPLDAMARYELFQLRVLISIVQNYGSLDPITHQSSA